MNHNHTTTTVQGPAAHALDQFPRAKSNDGLWELAYEDGPVGHAHAVEILFRTLSGMGFITSKAQFARVIGVHERNVSRYFPKHDQPEDEDDGHQIPSLDILRTWVQRVNVNTEPHLKVELCTNGLYTWFIFTIRDANWDPVHTYTRDCHLTYGEETD